MKEKIKEIFTEKWILQNMTKVIVFILIILWVFFVGQQFLIFLNWLFAWNLLLDLNILSFAQVLSFSGLILAFWYGFKRYERDKELELLDKTITRPPDISNPDILIFNWSLLYNLKKNDYIKEDLWLDLENQYMQNFQELLKKSDGDMEIYTNLMRLLIPIKNRSYFKTIPDKLKGFYNTQIVFPEKMYPDGLHKQYTLILKKIEDFKELMNQI